jgi:threonine synthase
VSTWNLVCSSCDFSQPGDQRASLCPVCAQPLFARYDAVAPWTTSPRWDLWRYQSVLPLADGESLVSLGEGLTPLVDAPGLAQRLGVRRVWIKDEAQNPTGSFKARGMSAAITRARALGAAGVVIPTAGNAGAAIAAYGAAAGLPVRVYAPRTTPTPILSIIRALGADLHLVDGHIGDAGKLSRAFAAESDFFELSTLREPYRVEGMKTMGYELAEQLGGRLPDALVYPTGGGEGTVGIWKAFGEMRDWGWLPADTQFPRMIVAQATGCAPIVRAFEEQADRALPWENPSTHAAGIRVPGPLGDRLLLRLIYESQGAAAAVDEEAIRQHTRLMAESTGVDAAPEGGAALATTRMLVEQGNLSRDSEVVIFNTGSGASYRVAD